MNRKVKIKNLESTLDSKIDLVFDPLIESLRLNFRPWYDLKLNALFREKLSYMIYTKIAIKLITYLERELKNG